MIKSMTGYGRAERTVNDRTFAVEIRSVNNRYLDCSVRLPRTLSFAEDAVKQAVKGTVSRGKVEVTISFTAAEADAGRVRINQGMVLGYLTALRDMASDYCLMDDLTASVLAGLPDVFLMEKPELDRETLQQDLLGVVQEALTAFDTMRTVEGAALEQDLRRRRQTVLELVEQVEAGSGQTVVDYRTRLEEKLREVLADTTIDEARILTEAAIFADKVAVDEETVRLRSHLQQMEDMLDAGGDVGRKLDFLLQEMNREANTIGSKCTDVRLARIVVDIKAELEKIREQTQNLS